MKIFDLSVGALALDPSFALHQSSCAQCQRFSPEKPGTAGELCLEGSVLWKRDNPTKIVRPRMERSKYYCSKDELNALMKYK